MSEEQPETPAPESEEQAETTPESTIPPAASESDSAATPEPVAIPIDPEPDAQAPEPAAAEPEPEPVAAAPEPTIYEEPKIAEEPAMTEEPDTSVAAATYVASNDGVPPAGEDIHLPPGSIIPLGIAFGLTLILVGTTINWLWTILGGIVFIVCLSFWIRDTRREVAHLPDELGASTHH